MSYSSSSGSFESEGDDDFYATPSIIPPTFHLLIPPVVPGMSDQSTEGLPLSSRFHTPRDVEEWNHLSPLSKEILRQREKIASFFPVTGKMLTPEVRKEEYEWVFKTDFPLSHFAGDLVWRRLWEYKVLKNIFTFLNIGALAEIQHQEMIQTDIQIIRLQVLEVTPSPELYQSLCDTWQSYPNDDFVSYLYIMQSEATREVRFQLICQSNHVKRYFPHFRGHITYAYSEDRQHLVQNVKLNCLVQMEKANESSTFSWITSKTVKFQIANRLYYAFEDLFVTKLLTTSIYFS